MGKFTFTVRTVPECEEFLKIQWPGEEYVSIDSFIETHPEATEEEIDRCSIWYRGAEQTYKEYINNFVAYTEELEFLRFNAFKIITNPNIKASLYFIEKTADCLQNARYFAVKSNLHLDSNKNMLWKHGYVPQFSLRCTFFGTAATWYSNTFDQLLQAVYWGFELYSSAKDRDGNPYDEQWDVKKIMTFCTYEFVVGELKNRGLTEVRKLLTSCSGKIEEVRTWANYIKHKGGIEYKYLEPDDPIKVYIMPAGEKDGSNKQPDERFEIKNFKSPIEIDIDEKIAVLTNAHKALYECISKTIEAINFDKYQLSFGG